MAQSRSACDRGNTPRCPSGQEQRTDFEGILSLTPGFSQVQYEAKTLSRFNGFDNAPKPLKRLDPLTARNTGLKSGVTEIVRNYMIMARQLKCDMFQAA
jgi:hypothetical protein